MTAEREAQVVERLRALVAAFVPTEDESRLTMFGLISRYNAQYDNPELIGGDWVLENTDIRLPD